MKFKKYLIVILFLIIVFNKFYGDVKYFFKGENEKKYELLELPLFISEVIVKSFGKTDETFKVYISKQDNNIETDMFNITMNKKNLYLIEINGITLPGSIVKYNNRIGLKINKENLIMVLEDIQNHDFSKFTNSNVIYYLDLKEKLIQQRDLKMLAFIFAESARFESVRNALTKILTDNCSIEWHDFDFALHNWSNISRFIISKKTITENQIRGGTGNQLVIPILLDNERLFIYALEEKENYRFSTGAAFFGYNFECPSH